MVNLVCPEVPIQELPCSIKSPRILGLIFARDYLQKEVCRLTEADFIACRAIHWQGYATLTNAPAAVKSFLCIPEQQYNNVYDLKLERGFEAHTQYAKILMFAHLYRVAIIWEDGHYSGFYDFSTQGGSMTYGNVGTTVSELTIKISTSSLAVGFSDGSQEDQVDVRRLFNYMCSAPETLPSCLPCGVVEAAPVILALEQAAAIDGYDMSLDYVNLVCSTVEGLVNCGAWELIDIMYFPMARTRGMGLINWKNPGTFDLTPVNSNINDFVVNEGFRSAGVFYLDSNWNPVVDGVNYTINGSSWAVMMRNMVKSTQYLHTIQVDPFPFPIGTGGSTLIANQANKVGFSHDEQLNVQIDLRLTASQPLNYNFAGSSRLGAGVNGVIQHCFDGLFDPPVISGLPQVIPNSKVVVNGARNSFTLAAVPDSTNTPLQFTMRGGHLSQSQMLCLYNAVENFYNQLQVV